MSARFENLRILQQAVEIADRIWKQVVDWQEFERDTVGKQLVRAADSVGANIAESFGRFHYGEKLQFLYYARGSLFETKYWLNRALSRELMASEPTQIHITQLTDLVRQLNAFSNGLKAQRKKTSTMRETATVYTTSNRQHSIPPLNDEISLDMLVNSSCPLFTEDEIEWLQTIPAIDKKF